MNTFQSELESLINRTSQECGSDTPDFVLAQYMDDSLKAFNAAVRRRSAWYRDEAEAPEDKRRVLKRK